MGAVASPDGVDLFYKDWGPKDARPVMFHHGWPLSFDDWDGQMLFFLSHGYRVIAHDRRGHGRSDQTDSGAGVRQGLIDNGWRKGMAGGAKAQHDRIEAFSETDFTDDLSAIKAPVLFLHGEDDQIVPTENAARKAVGLGRDGTLRTCPGLSHGLFATHPEGVNPDLLSFVRA